MREAKYILMNNDILNNDNKEERRKLGLAIKIITFNNNMEKY
jgi:ribosome-associated protein YbcJ (S4-like RNA binding protein)